LLHKAFVIIQKLATSNNRSSINDLSKSTGIPRSTVHRILTILIKEEVVKLVPNKGYILTTKLFYLGLMGLGKKELIDVAVPVLRETSAIIKETISIYILSGMGRMCIYSVEGELPILQRVKIGDKGPLLLGSAGKILAMGLNKKELDSVIKYYLEKGDITREDVPRIQDELEKARVNGYAKSIEERFLGCASVSVPIRNMTGHIQAALNVAMPSERADDDNINVYQKVIFDAARSISEQLGYIQ